MLQEKEDGEQPKSRIRKNSAVVKEFSDADVMEIALIENLQREDLNPLEEAEAYKTLMSDFGLTQEELSKRLGKSRSLMQIQFDC